MHLFYRFVPLLAIFFSLILASSAAQQSFYPFRSIDDSVAAVSLIERYLAIPEDRQLDSMEVARYTVGTLSEQIAKRGFRPLRFPSSMKHTVTAVRMIREDNSQAIVVVSTDVGIIPMFGPFTIDWVYYLVSTEDGWRINTFERQSLLEEAAAKLSVIDTTSQFPPSLKPVIAREYSSMLLSNMQLREHFLERREAFESLLDQFRQHVKLGSIGRVDQKPSQINNVVIQWGGSAQDIPKEAIDEYMSVLTKEEQKQFRKELKTAEKLRRVGSDSVMRIAKRLGIDHAVIDSTIRMMRELRINFANARLPWDGAVQFTVAGESGYSLGYLYSPGQTPLLSPDEYFYLEEIADGWWIFRAS